MKEARDTHKSHTAGMLRIRLLEERGFYEQEVLSLI